MVSGGKAPSLPTTGDTVGEGWGRPGLLCLLRGPWKKPGQRPGNFGNSTERQGEG